MKKIVLATMLSGMLLAGGDLPEVEYITVEEAPQSNPFYIGIGVGADTETEYDYQYDYSNVSLLAGALVAREGALGLAIEARLSSTLDDYGVDTLGLYLKPEFETTSEFTVFGILGYQSLSAYEFTYDAIGVGIGGVMMFTEQFGAQVDYVYSVIEEDVFGFTPEYANLTVSAIYKF